MSNKDRLYDKFLGMVIPLVMIYTSCICLYTYFLKCDKQETLLDVIVIFLCSFLMVYGGKALLSDLRVFGIRWTLRNFFKNEL